MDRQTSGRSFAASAYAQTHLKRGDPSQWDLWLVLWLLLHSGHDGQDSGECRGLLHAISSLQAGCTISEADADARTAAARTALAELRKIRNTLEGHKLKWMVPHAKFKRTISKCLRIVGTVDHLRGVRAGDT